MTGWLRDLLVYAKRATQALESIAKSLETIATQGDDDESR
jgi:hypothetical protein